MPMAAIASEYKRAGDSIRTSLYLLSGDIVQWSNYDNQCPFCHHYHILPQQIQQQPTYQYLLMTYLLFI